MKTIAPISAVIATRNRAESLSRTLESLLTQALLPAEFIVVDASSDGATKNLLINFAERVGASVNVSRLSADTSSAASQRNQGVAQSLQPFIWFFDDDIFFEQNCVSSLWQAIESDSTLGGVNAMIVNQRYQPPGLVSRLLFTLMHGRREETFAGKVIGPAVNLLPEDGEDLPEVVPVEWLNTTCTIYRREALPQAPFDSFFTGYSLMEDLALSLRVGKNWRLANVRTARIVHESQSGGDKPKSEDLAEMELVNRYYVMTNVMGKRRFRDILRFVLWELFLLVSTLTQAKGFRTLPQLIAGKVRGLFSLPNLSSR